MQGNLAEVADAVNEAARPLMQDEDLETTLTGAVCLATMFKNRADSDVVNKVVRIAIEGIKSDNDDFRSLGLSALQDASATKERLGTNPAEAIPPLMDMAKNANAKDHQMRALELLNAVQPELLAASPAMNSLLQTYKQDIAFGRKVGGWDETNIMERFYKMKARARTRSTASFT